MSDLEIGHVRQFEQHVFHVVVVRVIVIIKPLINIFIAVVPAAVGVWNKLTLVCVRAATMTICIDKF